MNSFSALLLTQVGRSTEAALVALDDSNLPEGNVEIGRAHV